jgi:acyl-coenzyme A thioesterase PaaI-like protein
VRKCTNAGSAQNHGQKTFILLNPHRKTAAKMFKNFFRNLTNKPEFMRRAMNFYAPIRGAGIQVERIAPNFDEVEVVMPLTRRNKNIMGTQFGGSLYAMADPFFMLILMKRLGHRYHVWDQEASIRFVSPGTSAVKGVYRVNDHALEEIKALASTGEKVLYNFAVDITQKDGTVVAQVTKVLYIRLKKQYRPQSN